MAVVFLFLFCEGQAFCANESEKHWRIDEGAGAQTFNYAATAPLFYTQVFYRKPQRFFLLGRFDYLDKFNDKTFSTTLGGGYYVLPKLILSDQFGFAPGAFVVPEVQNQFEISGILPHGFAPYLRYGYRHYQVADVHLITPGVSWYWGERAIFDVNYTLAVNNIDGLSSGRTDHNVAARITLIPWKDRLKFFVHYARTEESFDAGNPVLPFGRFHANHVGGGFEWAFLKNFGVRFYMDYENRDNGQTAHVYESGFFQKF
ncbi:MAG: YaiO family outer membrane beta-barrel protein [bacterium]